MAKAKSKGVGQWFGDNIVAVGIVAVVLGLGFVAFMVYGRDLLPAAVTDVVDEFVGPGDGSDSDLNFTALDGTESITERSAKQNRDRDLDGVLDELDVDVDGDTVLNAQDTDDNGIPGSDALDEGGPGWE